MPDIADFLREHNFSKGFWPEHIARLAAMASEVHFRSGELIFHEGDRSSLFYLLVSGRVALEVVDPGRPVRLGTLYSGEVLGWSSLTTFEKQFQARALEDVHALAFDGTRLLHACEEDYGFGFVIMRAALKVTVERLHTLRTDLLEVYNPVEALV
ncbi:MAG: Crp/Fnr family transcriptional regulator [Terriglobia bacterium]|nr:MAG: Crp/Fnr family transcriptional regulator [Terriglobia bacterium]